MKLLVTLPCALLCTLSLVLPAALAQTTINVGPGQSYTTIQSGIDAANNGDTVLVAPGTYNENIDFKGKAITVTSSGGAAVTIIDGRAAPGLAVVDFHSNENRTSVLSNFTIRNGGPNTFTSQAGGGIYVSGASPTILNNIITENECNGIDVSWGAALIQGNTISATSFGENAYCWEGVALVLEGNQSGTMMFNSVIGNTIENNASRGDNAAAILIWVSNGNIIVGNTIRNNVSSQAAVQMYNSESIVFSQNLVYGNSISGNVAGYGGAGGLSLLIPDGAPPFYGIIVNNTFANNTTSPSIEGASQVFIDGDVSKFSFVNNIVYGASSVPLLVCNGIYAYLSPGPMLVENNDVFNSSGPAYDSSCANGAGAAGNISADPLFNSPANNDFHLQSGSPAIDTGNNQALAMLTPYGIDLTTDLAGNTRVQDATGKGCIIDMGVYEYPGSVSDCGVSVTETLTSSLNPAMAGQSVTFTAQLSATGGTPTGTIQFLDGTNILSTQTVSSAGSASITTSSLTVGSHTITANYQPTGSFDPATASLVEVIEGNATNTALTCLPNPINIYQTAQFTVTVTSAAGTPTGSVSFTDNGASLGTNNLAGGSTRLTYTGSTAGTHDITANYVPTGSFAASSATCSEVVNSLPTTSTLTVAPASSSYGSSIALTATVSPATLPGPSTPTGMVTFYNGASAIGVSTLTGGVATLSTASLPGGSYSLTCMYGGSSIYSPSNCNAVSAIITAAATSISLSGSPDPGELNQTIKFNADVSSQSASVGNGTVTFYDGNSLLGSSPVSASGAASITSSFTTVGTHNITAVYGGDADFSSSTSAVFKEAIVAGDFSIDVVPGSATVYTGEAAAVKVSITSLQGFNQPLALACSGLPANATCSFNSATLPEGAGAANLVIQTAAPHKEAAVSAAMLSALTLLLLPGWRRRRRFLARLVVLSLVIGAGIGLSGCGSVSSITGGTTPGTYQIEVTATSVGNGTTLEHSAVVTLEVKSLF